MEVGALRFEQTERLPAGHDGAVARFRAYALVNRCGLHHKVHGRARQELLQLRVSSYALRLGGPQERDTSSTVLIETGYETIGFNPRLDV